MSLPIPSSSRSWAAYQKSFDYSHFSQRSIYGSNKTHERSYVDEPLPERETDKKILKSTRRHNYHVDVSSQVSDYLYSETVTYTIKKYLAFGGPSNGKYIPESPRPQDYRLFRDYHRPEPGSDRWVYIHKDMVK